MKAGFKDLIQTLDLEELSKVREDVASGGVHILRLLELNIKQRLKEQDMNCSVCGGKMDPNNINNFTLIFGPHDFQRKASFCAVDCLEYFIDKLKGIRDDARFEG